MPQPVYQGLVVYIGEYTITLQYDIALDAAHPPTAGQFSLTADGGSSTYNVTSVSVDSAAKTVTLTTDNQFSNGTIIDQLLYTDDSAGNDINAIQGLDGTDATSLDTANYSYYAVNLTRPVISAPSTPVVNSASDSGVVGDAITNVTTPTITGTGTVGATVHLFDGATDIGNAVVAAGGGWSITLASALSSGTHTLTAKQVDGANTSVASPVLTLTVDTTAPGAPSAPIIALASDNGPSHTDGITNTTTPVITGTAEIGSTVRIYDTDNTQIGIGTANGSGNYNISVSALSAGAHTLTAKATDVAGNPSIASTGTNILIDVVAPTGLALSTTSANVTGATNGSTIATLSATDSNAITYALATGNGTNDSDNSKFSVTGTQLLAAQNLTAGAYHVYLNATDAAGNVSVQAFTLNVVSGPSVTSIVRTAAAAATLDHTAASATYTVTFSEGVTGVGVTDFTLAPTGNVTGTISNIEATNDSVYIVTVSGISGDGTLGLNLNTSGTGISNAATEAIIGGFTGGQTYTLDHTAPATPSAPALTLGTDTGIAGDGITSNTTPSFTGTGEIGSTVKLFDASNGNALVGSATVAGNGQYTITPGTPLSAGAHSLYAQASDAAANTSAVTTNLAVSIDNVAPTAIVLPTATVYTNAGLNAVVGTLGATDAVRAGAFSYQLVPGIGGDDNANFTLTSAGQLSLNDPGTVGLGTESIRVRVTDAAGNIFTQVLTVTVTTAPEPAAPANTGSTTIDGVAVTTTSVTLPGGGTGSTLTIPVVSATAGGSIGAPNVADIPLVTANTSSLLTAQVPIGTGLTSMGGASKPAGNSLAELVAAIRGQTATHTVTDQTHLAGNGSQFLSLLATGVPLLINTVVVTNTDATSSTPLTLTGTSTTSQHTALIIDTSQLANSSTIILNNVDFAAVVGAVTITGNTAGQIITGDVTNQNVIIGAGKASQVYTGGGSDSLQYGLTTATATTVDAKLTAALIANSTNTGGLTAATSILLNGGTGSDTAVFGKAQSAYSIDQRDGYVLVTDKADTTQRITVTNTESLKFSDGVVAVQSRAELTVLAGLYQSVLGRQADIGGFDYWGASQATGVSLGAIAVNMLGSTEAAARGLALNGDASHDIATLYQALFGRAPEASGLAYWKDVMAHGQSIVDVANGFIAATEIAEHKLAATSWDLMF